MVQQKTKTTYKLNLFLIYSHIHFFYNILCKWNVFLTLHNRTTFWYFKTLLAGFY